MGPKPMAAPPRVPLWKSILVTGGVTLALLLVLFPALYFLGLAIVGDLPDDSYVPEAPLLLSAALWAGLEGDGQVEVEPLGPVRFVRLRMCRTWQTRFGTEDAAERCWKDHPGILAAISAANQHLQRREIDPESITGRLGQLSMIAWMTRNRSGRTLLNMLARDTDFGFGWVGVESAADEYFGTTPEALTPGQAALLAAVFNDPEAFHPWCRPTAARSERNRILDRMLANGAIGEAIHARGISEPLGVTTQRGC